MGDLIQSELEHLIDKQIRDTMKTSICVMVDRMTSLIEERVHQKVNSLSVAVDDKIESRCLSIFERHNERY